MYRGAILRNETIDPEYKVKFDYVNDRYTIKNGTAIFTRQSPVPKVTFDDYTDYLLEKLDVDDQTIQNIRLEVGKTVCDYIFSTMELKDIR